MSTAGDVLVAVGALLSAVAGVFSFTLDGDTTKLQNKIKRKTPTLTTGQAGTKARKQRQTERRVTVGLFLILAVLANVAALVFG